MIVFPTTIEDAVKAKGEFRAGGTDLVERRNLGIATGDIVDLRDVGGLETIEAGEGGALRIGARTRIVDIASSPEVAKGYPGLAAAAGGLATPQIRAVGTLGGNLLQRTRCWYFRSPEAKCLKKGGKKCYAREGDHLFHACFDLGPCASVHPSTLGMALMAYDAQVEVAGGKVRTIAELYGDGSDARRDHQLEDGALLTAVVLPAAAKGERAAYFRAISRSRSEWPLVEVLARLVVEGETIKQAAVAIGGVAPVPLRLHDVDAALVGKPASAATFRAAAEMARKGASPLPMTGYKVELVEGTVLEALERAVATAKGDAR
jgi:xanthine dehydrogenase YagS FAD-binding subunit